MLTRNFHLVYLDKVHTDDELLLNVLLLVILVEVKESFEYLRILLIFATEVPAIISGLSVFVGGSLAVSAELLYLLRVDAMLHEDIDVICPVDEVVVAAQLMAMFVLDRDVVEETPVHPVDHQSIDFVFLFFCMLVFHVPF
jgi:hypothetical protein